MIRTAGSLLFLLALLVGSAVPVAAAPAGGRHSGVVSLLDPVRGVMIVDEVGPWGVENGRTVTTRLTIELTPDTQVNTFIRVTVPDRFTGDFIEVALDAADVIPGDIVTVDCRHEDDRLIAVTVTVASLD